MFHEAQEISNWTRYIKNIGHSLNKIDQKEGKLFYEYYSEKFRRKLPNSVHSR